ncbi:PHP domain-containing protein [Peptostreptococcus canis]|uniref:PHP domain-containing protein n=1 Tax=Peptostreptococcus canis TaxID=1159213 RepID=A0ABR6TJ89_9FIRM|nr:PHP domain-containing protein [Peptostreptococcus canis]MBC2575488.1 PHP domain-containing protein [Peptostreptococcus canis]MBP1997320.1 putative hydrolase [Peptostreptococcus canis]
MKILADYHTHTIFSCGGNDKRRHAKGTIEDNVISAVKKGIETIGISEHGFSHIMYGLSKENAEKERKEIDRLNEKYAEINILMGMECNILDDTGRIDMPDDQIEKFDYILAGYHFGSKSTSFESLLHHIDNFLFRGKFSKEYNTRAVINAMRKYDILYITHPGDKGAVDIEKIAEVAEETNTGLEINGHHAKLDVDMIKKIKHRNIKFYIGSDAHDPKNVANFEKAMKIVRESELELDRIVNIQK